MEESCTESESSSALVLTRTDGFGQRVLAFLAARDMARSLRRPLTFLWHEAAGMRQHGVQGTIADVFTGTIDELRFVREISPQDCAMPVVPQWPYWKGVLSLKPLADEARALALQPDLAAHVASQPRYRVAVHARQGDVAEQAAQYGLSKWLPQAMYEQLFRELASSTCGKDVFIASDSAALKAAARRYLPNCGLDDQFYTPAYAQLNPAQKLWLTIEQLARADQLFSPPCSAFGLLARLRRGSLDVAGWESPAVHLGLADMHLEYMRRILPAPARSASPARPGRIARRLLRRLRRPSRPVEMPAVALYDRRICPVSELPSRPTPIGMEAYRFD